jgi:hypothetical protein
MYIDISISVDGRLVRYLAPELFYGELRRRDNGVSTHVQIVYCKLPKVMCQVCIVHVPLACNTGPGVRINQNGNQWPDGVDQGYPVNFTRQRGRAAG